MNYIETLKLIATNVLPKIALVLGLVYLVSFLSKRLLGKLKTSSNAWARTLGEAWYSPIQWLVWALGVVLSLEALGLFFSFYVPGPMLAQLRHIILIGGATWLLFCWKTKVEKILMHKVAHRPTFKSDQSLISVLGKIVSIALMTISGLMVLSTLQVPLAGLVATGSVGTIAIGFAGQDVGKNFFGGLMIYINRPFEIGDWIYSPNKNFEGVVEDIGWYMTQIRTFERRPTYIPNAVITDAIIENPGRMYNRRIKQTIGVRYCDADVVEPIVNDIERMLKSHPEIAQNQILMVHLVDFGPSSLNIEVYSFTKTTNWAKYREIQQDVLLRITSIVTSHNAEIAFPTNTLHIKTHKQEPSFA